MVLSGHDISSAWNNPAGFVSFEKVAKFVLVDGSGNGAEIGLKGIWNLAQQSASLYIYSDDSNGNASISEVELNAKWSLTQQWSWAWLLLLCKLKSI